MNKIIVIGHLGRDPEMRYTPNGQPVTSFSVASSRHLTKGQQVMILAKACAGNRQG